ncbi:STAS domain-containing protein [Syntrophomonas palmitatica]|uniref:STAS domain-containing protein n=1 Tax=Syntrophomonas palmitatica TaxID=402877 RepID=UPI0006D1E4F7|nr:STAS domain-containing protein [Syntrophomonas palmitatica]
MLEIKVSRLDGISTFAMHGRFDGLGAQLFEQEASGELDWGNHWILDFNGVNYLSSVGIRSLIKYGKKLKSANKMIILSALSKEVRTVLDTTGVLGLFKEAASSEEAQVSLSTEKDIASTVKEFSAYGRDCTLQIYPHQNCVVEVWNPGSALDAHNNHSGDLIMVANEDIQLAFGWADWRTTRKVPVKHGDFCSY